MNKNEFLSQLEKKLKGLPSDEIKTAITYYQEYFDEAGVENEQAVITELGSPSDVASKIIGESAMKKIEHGEKTAKKGLGTIWIVILGIFASPIALPLAIAAVAIVFALLVVLCSLIFAFGAVTVALIIAGIVTLFMCFFLLLSDFATAIFFIGLALVSIGIGMSFFVLTGYLAKNSLNLIAKKIANLLKRRSAN